MICWYMQQHGLNSRILCSVVEVKCKKKVSYITACKWNSRMDKTCLWWKKKYHTIVDLSGGINMMGHKRAFLGDGNALLIDIHS